MSNNYQYYTLHTYNKCAESIEFFGGGGGPGRGGPGAGRGGPGRGGPGRGGPGGRGPGGGVPGTGGPGRGGPGTGGPGRGGPGTGGPGRGGPGRGGPGRGGPVPGRGPGLPVKNRGQRKKFHKHWKHFTPVHYKGLYYYPYLENNLYYYPYFFNSNLYYYPYDTTESCFCQDPNMNYRVCIEKDQCGVCTPRYLCSNCNDKYNQNCYNIF